eukprot:494887-Pleurochrysis_carterae.AAC.2
MWGGTAHSSGSGNMWTQTFKRAYTEQAFRRECVRAEMIHGEADAPYVQRKDRRLKTTGKDKQGYSTEATGPQPQAIAADTVLTKVAAMAVWPC